MRKKSTIITKSILRQVIFYGLLIAIWQGFYYIGVSELKLWKPYAVPNPVGVWESLLALIRQNALFGAVASSMKRVLFGYALSIAIGAFSGFLLIRFKIFTYTLKPLMLGVQTLPSICWVPFAILWFGLNERAILFVVVMGSTFSIAIAVDMAIRSVNPVFIKAARTMGAKGLNLYVKVVLPASLPMLITGLKQGWSFAWRSLMAGEVMTATVGLGQVLTMGRDLADINRVTLIILIIILLGVLIEKYVFTTLENKVLKRMGFA